MRIILWLVTACVALYAGYWLLAARSVKAGAETVVTEMRAAGTGDYQAFDLGGFPYRFDAILTEPRVTSPGAGVTWSAPALRLHALAYRPQHVIAVFPNTQTVRVGRETLSLVAADLTASARFGVSSALPLLQAESFGRSVALTSDFGWGVVADEVRAALRAVDGPATQRIGVELTGITLTGLPADLVTRGGAIPAHGERLHLDAVLTLDRPLDRDTPVEGIRLLAADIRALAFDWGPARLAGSGTLALDPAGTPEGRIDLSLTNWRVVLQLATALGVVRPDTVPAIARALEGLALLNGNAEVLALPLVFQSGWMSLGPIPLGPAPRL